MDSESGLQNMHDTEEEILAKVEASVEEAAKELYEEGKKCSPNAESLFSEQLLEKTKQILKRKVVEDSKLTETKLQTLKIEAEITKIESRAAKEAAAKKAAEKAAEPDVPWISVTISWAGKKCEKLIQEGSCKSVIPLHSRTDSAAGHVLAATVPVTRASTTTPQAAPIPKTDAAATDASAFGTQSNSRIQHHKWSAQSRKPRN